jgi:hypothetical protein
MKIKIEPQPWWEETPVYMSDTNEWVGRYDVSTEYKGDWDVDIVEPPNKSVKPVHVDGVWYWVDKKKVDNDDT